MDREEKCRRALKTLGKALFMRLLVTALLVLALVQMEKQLWVLGLMGFVLVINLAGTLPILGEWRKQRRLLHDILDQYE